MDEFYTLDKLGEFTVVCFQTPTLMNANELERIAAALDTLVAEDEVSKLLLDFTRVQYLSSQAIGIVLSLNKKLGQVEAGKLALCGVGPQLAQLLKLTRLDRILTIFESSRQALTH